MQDNSFEEDDDQAPGFRKWAYWYALVIGVLILLIGFFYILTKKFS
jgi:hypothetical protein